MAERGKHRTGGERLEVRSHHDQRREQQVRRWDPVRWLRRVEELLGGRSAASSRFIYPKLSGKGALKSEKYDERDDTVRTVPNAENQRKE